MKTILVWVLVSMSNDYSGAIAYSPPFGSLEECESVKTSIYSEKLGGRWPKLKSDCVKMNIIVTPK